MHLQQSKKGYEKFLEQGLFWKPRYSKKKKKYKFIVFIKISGYNIVYGKGLNREEKVSVDDISFSLSDSY